MYDETRSEYEAERAWKAYRRGESVSTLSDWASLTFAAMLIVLGVIAALFDLGIKGVLEWMVSHWGRALALPAVVICFALYWLKLKFQHIYGMIELFAACTVFGSFVSDPQRHVVQIDSAFLTSFVAGFLAPIYIAIRGIENVDKWMKQRRSPQDIAAAIPAPLT